MKKITTIVGSFLLLFSSMSLLAGTPSKSTRPATEDRAVSGFHGITSGGSYAVTVTIGSKESLRMEGDEDVLKDIETRVDNGILTIRNKASLRWNDRNQGRVKIYITAKSLNSLSASGSGVLEVLDEVKANVMTVSVSGSGSLRARISANELNGSISGSGSMSLSGAVTSSAIVVSGSGSFRGQDFKTDKAEVRVSGSGSVAIQAEKTIDAVLSGSGSVHYSGNATVNTRKSGSGRVVKI